MDETKNSNAYGHTTVKACDLDPGEGLALTLDTRFPVKFKDQHWPATMVSTYKVKQNTDTKSARWLVQQILSIIGAIFKRCYLKLALFTMVATYIVLTLSSEFLPRANEHLAKLTNSTSEFFTSTTSPERHVLLDNLPQVKRSDPARNKNKPDPVRAGQRRFPSCIIFGVSKCGTRAMLEYLKLHPEVVAPGSEINFFNNKTLQDRGMSWYLQQMPVSQPYQITVVKSPDYFQQHQCADLIYKTNNSTKLLLLLRDPVERLVSQYMQLAEKHADLPSFVQWVIDPSTGFINSRLPSVMVGMYSEHLEYWLNVFPRKQIHIIESDSLRINPLEEMKRVEKFLNLKPFFAPVDFYFNSSRGFYCTRLRSSGKTRCLGKSKGRPHILVDKSITDKLHIFYAPYNEKLNSILGMKFPWS